MCGLFGFQFNPEALPLPEERAILAYLLGDRAETRGAHACGFAAYALMDNTLSIHKESTAFTRSEMVTKVAQTVNVIAHTRFATVGARTERNAHPFVYGNTVGCHNGGIYNHREIGEKYGIEYEVDSEILISHIDNEFDCKELTGYGAVTWFDKRDPGAAYLCRMRSGDLVVERLPNGGIVWGSTAHILSSAMTPLGWYKESRAFQLDEGQVYRAHCGTITAIDRHITLEGGRIVHTYHPPTQQTFPVGASVTSPINTPFGASSNSVAVRSPEIVGSVHKKKRKKVFPIANNDSRGVSKSSYERLCDDYTNDYDKFNGKLEHYLAGIKEAQRGSDVPDKLLADMTLMELLEERFFIPADALDVMADNIDNMTRRRRRKYEKFARATVGHEMVCGCTICDKIGTLLDDITSGEATASPIG